MDRNQLSHGGCQDVEGNILTRQHTIGSRKVTEYGSIAYCFEWKLFEPHHDKTNKIASAQSDHSLRVRIETAWALTYPVSAHRRR